MPAPKGFRERKIGRPTRCARGSYRIKTISKNKRLVICCPAGKWMPRKKRCTVGTRAVAIQERR
jgi:hypothetical protein